MSNLSLFLLGSPQVELDGVTVMIRHSKAMALLIYLAVTGEPQRRDTLATILWPDSDQKSARASLRRELSLLKKSLGGDWLAIERETIGLRSDIWLDVTRFKQHLAAFNTNNPRAIDALTKAIALYRDNFLKGFTLPDCPEYDEWQFFQSENLQQSFANALEQAINELTHQHDYENAIPHARRWLALDPLHEPAHQMLMRLYALSGRQAAALRQFSECQQLLRDELGIEPDTETLHLEIAIRERRLKRADTAPIILSKSNTEVRETLLRQSAKPRSLFIGRESQLSNLQRAHEQMLKSQGQVRFITGEAGAGKSALVAEFIYRSQKAHSDLMITTGFCDAQTGAIDPYLPFREIFKSLIINQNNQRIQKMASSALLEYGAEFLHTIVPSKDIPNVIAYARQAGWQGNVPETSSHGFEQNKIFEQAVVVLQAIASHIPLILVLEDLHWADSGSIGILFRLARHLVDSRILVIGTYRPEAVRPDVQGDGHPLKKMVLELQRNLSDIHIDLEDARKSEEGLLVDGILDAEPNRLNTDFREALRQQTGGHPLFVVELVQELKKDDVLIRNKDGFWVLGTTLDWLSLPTRVEGAIAGRMAHLTAAQRWYLTIASVMGESFLVEVVAHVAGESPRELIQVLSRILQTEHRLVEAEGVERSGEQRLTYYHFRHNLMQVYLYERLDEVQRVYLHEDIANTLEALYAADVERIALSLAHHYKMAGITQKAVDYLQIAGKKAVHLGAHIEGQQHFGQALVLLAELPENQKRYAQELHLQFRLGQLLEAINGVGSLAAGDTYIRALALARQLEDTQKMIQVLQALTVHSQLRGDLSLARTYAEECLHLAEDNQNPEYLMEINRTLGSIFHSLGQHTDAVACGDHIIAFYRNHRPTLNDADAYKLATTLAGMGTDLIPMGFPDRAIRQAQEGITLMQHRNHPLGIAICQVYIAYNHQMCGNWRFVLQYTKDALDICNKLGFTQLRLFAELLRGLALTHLGQAEVGIGQVQQAIAERKKIGTHFGNDTHLTSLAEACGAVGKIQEGLVFIAEAFSQENNMDNHSNEPKKYQVKGDLLLLQDVEGAELIAIQEAAEKHFRHAIKIAQKHQAKLREVRALASLCRLLHRQGRDEGCRQQLLQLYDWFTEGFDTEDLRMVRTVLQA